MTYPDLGSDVAWIMRPLNPELGELVAYLPSPSYLFPLTSQIIQPLPF